MQIFICSDSMRSWNNIDFSKLQVPPVDEPEVFFSWDESYLSIAEGVDSGLNDKKSVHIDGEKNWRIFKFFFASDRFEWSSCFQKQKILKKTVSDEVVKYFKGRISILFSFWSLWSVSIIFRLIRHLDL